MAFVTPPDFDFVSSICSHGFFVLAPHQWRRDQRALRTVITIDEDVAVPVVIREPRTQPGGSRGSTVSAGCVVKLTRDRRATVRRAIRRMLRLDEDLAPFHDMCRRSKTHQAVARLRFGRLLRSASLFEDIVKVICTCNVTWRQTVAMIDRITTHWGVPTEDGAGRGFPTPARLARAPIAELKRKGRVGYRAEFLHRLAREVADGRLDLVALESFDGPSGELHRELRRLHGVGQYGASHLCMLLGRYDHLAIDTEMMRFLKERHPRTRWTPARVRTHYERWQPYAFLAYWFELWRGYTDHHGPAEQWEPDGAGKHITEG